MSNHFFLACSPVCVFPCGSAGKESAYSAGDPGSIPGSGRSPGEGNGNPLQYSGLENPVDGGSYSPWGRKESDTTKQLHFHFSLSRSGREYRLASFESAKDLESSSPLRLNMDSCFYLH